MGIFKKINSRGDTIVEVMIVLAVLGLAFAISTATASRGIQQSRNAEEHSQAMGVLNSQTELLRAAISKQKDLTTQGGAFCIPSTGNPTDVRPVTDPNDLDNGYPTECVKSVFYHPSITYTGLPLGCSGTVCTSGYYTLKVQWNGNGGLGKQTEVFTYRTHQLTANADPGIPLGPGAPQIQAVVKKITPNAAVNNGPNPSPGFNSSNPQVGRGGEKLDLNGATSQSALNIPDSGISFSNLVEFTNYSVTVSNLPGGFTLCTPTTYSGIQAVSGVTKRTFLIAPVCTPQTGYMAGTGDPFYHNYLPHMVYVDLGGLWGDGARRYDLDGASGYDWGPEIWTANGSIYFSNPYQNGAHFRRTYIRGTPWYNGWDWQYYPNMQWVQDGWDPDPNSYYGEPIQIPYTYWVCPN
jgi:type II secretory pathway pseudopilin PulG